MTALASTAQYEAITGTTLTDPSAELTRVETLLGLASDAVLAGAHGQAIVSTTYTDETLRTFEGVAYFPQRPVTDVASVVVVDAAGNETTLTEDDDYRWEAGGNGRPAKLIRRRYGRDDWFGTSTVVTGFDPIGTGEAEIRVTYTAGWDPIPGPLVAATVAMAASIVANGGAPASTQRTVGPFTSSNDPEEIQSPTLALTPAAQALLDSYCKVSGQASVPVSSGGQ